LKFVDDADQVALLRCNKSNCAAGGKVDLSWQEVNDRQCSNCYRVFLWFSIMHGRLMIQKVCILLLKDQEKWTEWATLQHLLWYDGKDILTGHESWVHHYQPESECFNTMKTSQFKQKYRSSRLCNQLGRLRLLCFGILRE
jgi:hypothetical protein